MPMTLLSAMAAVDLIAQYTVAATDLPPLLHVSPDVIRFLRVRLNKGHCDGARQHQIPTKTRSGRCRQWSRRTAETHLALHLVASSAAQFWPALPVS